MLRFLFSILSIGLMISCKSIKERQPEAAHSSVFAGTFMVTSLYGETIEGYDLNLKINDRTSQISGLSGCNTYTVSFKQDTNSINFTPVSATKRFCSGLMELETRFLNIFKSSKEYKIQDDILTLYENQNEVLKATLFIL